MLPTDEIPESDTALSGATLSEPALAEDWLRDEENAAWVGFVGVLKTSPNWAGEPLAVQEAMRNEWERLQREPEFMAEKFIREDVDWGLRGKD